MIERPRAVSPDRALWLEWVAGMGAVTAEALACHLGTTVSSARARLSAGVSDRLIVRHNLLARRPALYAITPAGLRAGAVNGIKPCRVSGSNALHLIVCAQVAVALERSFPDNTVQGERELRRDERELGAVLASARLGHAPSDEALLHRPDLVLWQAGAEAGLPVAVEVELTIKAPRRLLDICRAWARCRCVAGVVYLAPAAVERAVQRAIRQAQADEQVVVVPLSSLLGDPRDSDRANRPKRCLASTTGATDQPTETNQCPTSPSTE